MTKRLIFVAGLLVGGALGFGIASWASRPDRAALEEIREHLAAVDDRPPVVRSASAPARAAASSLPRDELTRAVRDAIQAEKAAAALAAAPPAKPAPTPENVEAYRAGQGLVQRALETKVWTESQRDELQGLLAQMSEDQRQSLMRTLLPAINRGDVVPDGPPL